jgi:hypothetical protein
MELKKSLISEKKFNGKLIQINLKEWAKFLLHRGTELGICGHIFLSLGSRIQKAGLWNQWNRIESTEMNAHTYGYLIFDKGAKTIQCVCVGGGGGGGKHFQQKKNLFSLA